MPVSFFLCYLWLLLLVGLWLVCVLRLPGEERKGLLPAGLAVFLLAGVLFGGDLGLAALGLTWRTWLRYLLCVLLWVSGLTAGVLTVRDASKLGKARGSLRWAMVGTAAFALGMSMFFGTILGFGWSFSPGETVGLYHGERVVQGEWHWVGDTSYELYEYRGPFVRGKKSILFGIDPVLENTLSRDDFLPGDK